MCVDIIRSAAGIIAENHKLNDCLDVAEILIVIIFNLDQTCMDDVERSVRGTALFRPFCKALFPSKPDLVEGS